MKQVLERERGRERKEMATCYVKIYFIPPLIPSYAPLQVTKRLIMAGAEVNAMRDTLTTPLHAAAVIGHTDIIELLLEVRNGCET